MPTENNCGIHATCKKNFHSIMTAGFYKSQDNRSFGPAVYFYDKSFNGEYYADLHRKKILTHKHCEKNDPGILIQADLSCDSEFILDIADGPLCAALNKIEKEYWKEADQLDLTYEQKRIRLNRRRTYFIYNLIPDFIKEIAIIKAKLPYKRKSYAQGLIVYDTNCIKSLKEIEYAS